MTDGWCPACGGQCFGGARPLPSGAPIVDPFSGQRVGSIWRDPRLCPGCGVNKKQSAPQEPTEPIGATGLKPVASMGPPGFPGGTPPTPEGIEARGRAAVRTTANIVHRDAQVKKHESPADVAVPGGSRVTGDLVTSQAGTYRPFARLGKLTAQRGVYVGETRPVDGACDVCGASPAVPRNSALGAFTFAYCDACLRAGREPYGALVGSLMGLSRSDVASGAIREAMDATLPLIGLTEDELWGNAREAESEYDAWQAGSAAIDRVIAEAEQAESLRAEQLAEVERVQRGDCPAIGVFGQHSDEWYAGEACQWCGEVPEQ